MYNKCSNTTIRDTTTLLAHLAQSAHVRYWGGLCPSSVVVCRASCVVRRASCVSNLLKHIFLRFDWSQGSQSHDLSLDRLF